MKIKKYILFALMPAIMFLLKSGLALALEVNLPGLKENPSLADYTIYIFGFFISIAGIVSVISFVVGAVSLIASADNAEMASNAKDRMKGAVLGLVLTLASFIIITTINPALKNPNVTPVATIADIYYSNGNNKELRGALMQNEDTSNTSIVPAGYNTILYPCTNTNGKGPTLLVWTFPKANYLGSDGAYAGDKVQELNCGGSVAISPSYKIDYKNPGVYYYLESGCKGFGSSANTASRDNIGSPFAGSVKSVKFIGNYGVIFHKEIGLVNGGDCSLPIIASGDGDCEPVNISAWAADIFQVNQDIYSSGNGVSFYSAPFEDVTGARAGYYDMSDDEIALGEVDPGLMCFDYNKIDRPGWYEHKCTDSKCGGDNYSCDSDTGAGCFNNEVCNDDGICVGQNGEQLCSDNGQPNAGCETFKDCPGSIKINGSYLMALYSGAPDKNKISYCKTFTTDVPDLLAKPATPPGGKIDDVYVIPTL